MKNPDGSVTPETYVKSLRIQNYRVVIKLDLGRIF